MDAIKKLRAIIMPKDQKFLILLLVLSIVFSLIETIGISAIMPFISMASNPDIVTQNKTYYEIYKFFNFDSINNFIIMFGLLLIAFYVFRAIYTISYSYLLYSFSFGRNHEFAFKLFQNYMLMPYQAFTNRNSAIMTKTIISESANLTSLIQQLLIASSELFTILFIYILLLAVHWQMTLILTVILGVKVLFLSKSIGRILKHQGIKRSEFQDQFYKIINQSFGNFKIIKLLGNEQAIFNDFETVNKSFFRTNIINSTLSQLPRAILETIGFSILISVVIYILFKNENIAFILPIISMYALALYRILPAINKLISSYTNIMFYRKSLDILHEELTYTSELEDNDPISFNDSITLNNISFSYSENKNVINDFSLTINKFERVAFIGDSGAGKSTLVDLIIGFYKPQSGATLIDGVPLTNANIKNWRQQIGYIPQTIYLFDGTIAENIAFGSTINEARVIEVLKQTNMHTFVLNHEGLATHVGEGGIKLSGGQKQRIGIARALYSNPKILVLDEATAALDTQTESEIMDEIYLACKDKTLIIIAHRLSTIEKCDRVINVKL